MRNNYTIIFHPKAEKEYLESVIWYENSLIGLGQSFFTEIENALKQIQKKPLLFPQKNTQFREAVVKKFPYVIVYEIKEPIHQINILSVFHTKRNPKKKH